MKSIYLKSSVEAPQLAQHCYTVRQANKYMQKKHKHIVQGGRDSLPNKCLLLPFIQFGNNKVFHFFVQGRYMIDQESDLMIESENN
jgi:hypothetical protein